MVIGIANYAHVVAIVIIAIATYVHLVTIVIIGIVTHDGPSPTPASRTVLHAPLTSLKRHAVLLLTIPTQANILTP